MGEGEHLFFYFVLSLMNMGVMILVISQTSVTFKRFVSPVWYEPHFAYRTWPRRRWPLARSFQLDR